MRIMRGLRQDHFLTVEMRLLRIDDTVEGRVLLASDTLAGVQYGIEGLARMIGKTLTLVQAFSGQPVVQQEFQGGTQAHG